MKNLKLSKAETVALWSAVNWMDLCLRASQKERPDEPGLTRELDRLATAKRALRKVNAIRKSQ